MNYMKYNRTFVMLDEQSTDFSAREAPVKGYLKVETGNNKGALRCVVQNLRPYGRGEYVYKLIFFGKKKERTIHAILGGLVINRNGNGETYFRFDPLNFDGKGNRYDEFSVAIVAAVSGKNSKEPLHPILKGDLDSEEEERSRYVSQAMEEEADNMEANDRAYAKEDAYSEMHGDGGPQEDASAGSILQVEIEESEPEEIPESEAIPESEGPSDFGTILVSSFPEDNKRPNYNHFYNEYILQFCDHTCKVAGYYENVTPFAEDNTGARWKKMINVANLPLVSPGAHYFATQYHHYLFGAKPDEEGKAVRYFFAIPGRSNREEQPDGGRSGFLCWQPVMGSDGPGRGYGYWILAVDPATGNIEEV